MIMDFVGSGPFEEVTSDGFCFNMRIIFQSETH